MGFNFFSLGNIHPCGVQNGKIYYVLPSGKHVYFQTQLDSSITIKEQTNLFYSKTVAFLLYHDDLMYVGRFDKSISIYRTSDELLVGLNFWEPPRYADTVCCGFYNDSGSIEEIYIDLIDKQTLYISGTNMEGLANKPLDIDFDLDAAVFSARVFGNDKNYHIFTKRGEAIEVDVWTIQDDLRKRNCRIFL